jgi:hypothetical protein
MGLRNATLRKGWSNFPAAPWYVWDRLKHDMRVSEKSYKSVVFIGGETPNGFIPEGTGLIGVFRREDVTCVFVITARHVIDAIPRDQLAIRLNRKSGGAESLRVHQAATIMRFRPRAIDLAFIAMDIDPSIYDVTALEIDKSKWNAEMESAGTTPHAGDQIAVVGLYTSHYGKEKNAPVVRIGHLASLHNDEPVLTHRGYVPAFLAEVHSIAGLSGSPVYWSPPGGDEKVIKAQLALGILVGYHTTRTRGEEIEVPKLQPLDLAVDFENEGDGEDDAKWSDENRTGFGVVLPIGMIFQAFELENVRAFLEAGFKAFLQSSGYRDASGGFFSDALSPPSDANPTHREDFTSLLTAAVKKPAQED